MNSRLNVATTATRIRCFMLVANLIFPFYMAHAPSLAYTRPEFKLGLYRHDSMIKLDTGGRSTTLYHRYKNSWRHPSMMVNFNATYLSLSDRTGCHLRSEERRVGK